MAHLIIKVAKGAQRTCHVCYTLPRRRYHETAYKCKDCDVPMCINVQRHLHGKSGYQYWHEARRVHVATQTDADERPLKKCKIGKDNEDSERSEHNEDNEGNECNEGNEGEVLYLLRLTGPRAPWTIFTEPILKVGRTSKALKLTLKPLEALWQFVDLLQTWPHSRMDAFEKHILKCISKSGDFVALSNTRDCFYDHFYGDGSALTTLIDLEWHQVMKQEQVQ